MADSYLAQLYDEFADEYERTRVPRFRPFVKRLFQLYDTRPGSHVLDAGTGTGLAATMVAPRVGHGGKIVGVDASPRMLEIARRKAQAFGFDQCEFVVGDVMSLVAPDASFDLIVCSFALWGEPPALFGEFRRLLKPHGALLLHDWDWDGDVVLSTFNASLNTFATRSPSPQLAALRETFARQRAQWAALAAPDAYERALRAAGFASAAGAWASQSARWGSISELTEFHALGIPARAELAELDLETRERFSQAAADALRPLETMQGISIEWRAVQVIARK